MLRRRFIKSLFWSSLLALGASSTFALEFRHYQITRRRTALSGLKRPIRVTAVSDIHVPCIYSALPKIVTMINDTRPDIVILAGDIIARQGQEHRTDVFSGITPKALRAAVLGNWEYHARADLERLRKHYQASGIALLVNDAIDAGPLAMIGFDDWLFGRPDLNLVRDKILSGKPLLLVSHCPILFDEITLLPPSQMVMIAGHTHGGQIAPFGKALVTPKGCGPYVYGAYHRRGNTLMVTSGIGTSGPPIRIGAPPEIMVLDLEPA